MAHLSPRTKIRVHQISVFKKASGRSRRMVTAELMKKPELPPPAKKKTPQKGSAATVKNNVCPVPPAPRPIKRNRVEDHVYDSSGAPEVRRSFGQKNDVVPVVAPVVDEVEPGRRAQDNAGAPDSVREVYQRTSPSKESTPRPSPTRLASVIERPTATNDEDAPLSNGVERNGYHQPKAAAMDVQTEQCSDRSPVVEAYRMVDNSATCAVLHASPPTSHLQECATASPQANGFGNLLRRVGSPEPVCPTFVSSSVSSNTEANGDSDALTLRPAGQSVQRRSSSPEYIAAPRYFHGLWNLGNTCYMNTVVQLLYNLECFVADLPRPSQLPLRSDGIFLGLRQVFQSLAESSVNEVVNPSCLQHACEKYMTDFEGSIQQDAQEYLLNVLDKIEEEIASTQRQMWEESQAVPTIRERICPTTRNFSCQVRNILSCEGCDNIVNVEQSSRHFSLPLPEDRRDPQAEVPDIEVLMNIYFQVETVSRKCEKCGAETMKSETKIVQLPRVLILHINRFEIDRHMLCSKVSVPVKFTYSLDLGNWCLDKVRGPSDAEECVSNGREHVNGDLPPLEDCRESSHSNGSHSNGDGPTVPQEDLKTDMKSDEMYDSKENGFGAALCTRYSLHGVVSHVGKLASCGHYTVDIFDVESSKYVRCDDALVREVSPEDVFCEEKFTEAYVLLYVLQQNGGQRIKD